MATQRKRTRYDTDTSVTTQEHNEAMDELVGVSSNGVGTGASSGDMPITTFNNSYSGHAVFIIPDTMDAPAEVTYRDVFLVAKTQHPFLNLIPDVATTATNNPPVNSVNMTVLKVEFYGASAGAISLLPYIQHPPQYSGTTAVVYPHLVTGQQLLDVGTISRKPMLSHTWGDTINTSRFINEVATGLQFVPHGDVLYEYQYVQRALTPVPVDVGYIRVSFICRFSPFINLQTALPPPAAVFGSKTVDEMQEKNKKYTHNREKISRIDIVKRMTLPTLDQK